MPQSPAPLEVTHASGVTTLRFNRPGALNAIDVPMAQALMRAGMEAFFAKQSAQFEGR